MTINTYKDLSDRLGSWTEEDRLLVKGAFKEYHLFGVNWSSNCDCKWTDAWYILRSGVKSGQVALEKEEKEVDDEI